MVNNCQDLNSDSVAGALRSIDCNTQNIIESSFGKLFGQNGSLVQALSIILSIYVAWVAIKLLTGRGNLRLSALSPRMLGIGFVLTFATSWVAYQNVVLNLALGAPEQIAQILLNTKGSATEIFASKLDDIFNPIANATLEAASNNSGNNPNQPIINLMGLSGIMLLLSTVGVLIVSKIALSALLAIGPIFIIFALFPATRGLFTGWMKTIIMLAITPLLAVLLGGGTIGLISPLVQELSMAGNAIEPKLAVAIFLAASVHVSLMLMASIAAYMLVSAWQLPNTKDINNGNNLNQKTLSSYVLAQNINSQNQAHQNQSAQNDERVRSLISSVERINNLENQNNSNERIRQIISSGYEKPIISANNNGSDNISRLGDKFRKPNIGFSSQLRGL